MKPLFIYCEVFGRNIYVFHQWAQKDFEQYMMKNYKVTFKGLDNLNGCVRIIENKHQDIILLWTRPEKRKSHAIATLSHEATHVMNEVFRGAGVNIDTNNDEIQAYYQAWIVRRVIGCSK